MVHINKVSVKVNILFFPKVIRCGHNTIWFQAAQSSNAFDKMLFFQCTYLKVVYVYRDTNYCACVGISCTHWDLRESALSSWVALCTQYQYQYQMKCKTKVSYPVSPKFAKNSFPGVLDRDPGDEAGGRVEWLSAHVTHLRLGRCVQKHRCHQNVLAGDFSFI